MKEINYKDMKFNPFNLIGDEATDATVNSGSLVSLSSYSGGASGGGGQPGGGGGPGGH